ncbi:MAG: zinc-binding dehydrogenase, partial [Acidobacteria bacterium]|nr:zinc-binding dehydrogenase [Acidobacteriota bacterium]
GDTVLVQGAGSGVGVAAIQIARLHGARVIATAGSDAKVARALELGAEHGINYRTADFVAEAKRLTGKRGVDVVIDHVGGETFERSLRCLARGGRVVLCGATAAAEASINLRAVFFKSLSILGSTMGSNAELRTLLGWFERGELAPVVDRACPLEEAPAAQQRLAAREATGKIVLTVGDDAHDVPRPRED